MAIAILVYGRTHSPFLTALAYALTYLPPIAGAGGAYQLAAAAAFVRALRPDTRARAFGVA